MILLTALAPAVGWAQSKVLLEQAVRGALEGDRSVKIVVKATKVSLDWRRRGLSADFSLNTTDCKDQPNSETSSSPFKPPFSYQRLTAASDGSVVGKSCADTRGGALTIDFLDDGKDASSDLADLERIAQTVAGAFGSPEDKPIPKEGVAVRPAPVPVDGDVRKSEVPAVKDEAETIQLPESALFLSVALSYGRSVPNDNTMKTPSGALSVAEDFAFLVGSFGGNIALSGCWGTPGFGSLADLKGTAHDFGYDASGSFLAAFRGDQTLLGLRAGIGADGFGLTNSATTSRAHMSSAGYAIGGPKFAYAGKNAAFLTGASYVRRWPGNNEWRGTAQALFGDDITKKLGFALSAQFAAYPGIGYVWTVGIGIGAAGDLGGGSASP